MTHAALQVSHVTKRYGSGATEVTAVRDVSLTVASGEIVLMRNGGGAREGRRDPGVGRDDVLLLLKRLPGGV